MLERAEMMFLEANTFDLGKMQFCATHKVHPLDDNIVGKALSISNCPVPGCLGWGNIQRHQNEFHRTEEACPIASHMRKLSQNEVKLSYLTWVSTNVIVSTSIIDFASAQ
ncbi:unnamed protein product [Caenorhabditis brenneri]